MFVSLSEGRKKEGGGGDEKRVVKPGFDDNKNIFIEFMRPHSLAISNSMHLREK